MVDIIIRQRILHGLPIYQLAILIMSIHLYSNDHFCLCMSLARNIQLWALICGAQHCQQRLTKRFDLASRPEVPRLFRLLQASTGFKKALLHARRNSHRNFLGYRLRYHGAKIKGILQTVQFVFINVGLPLTGRNLITSGIFPSTVRLRNMHCQHERFGIKTF